MTELGSNRMCLSTEHILSRSHYTREREAGTHQAAPHPQPGCSQSSPLLSPRPAPYRTGHSSSHLHPSLGRRAPTPSPPCLPSSLYLSAKTQLRSHLLCESPQLPRSPVVLTLPHCSESSPPCVSASGSLLLVPQAPFAVCRSLKVFSQKSVLTYIK